MDAADPFDDVAAELATLRSNLQLDKERQQTAYQQELRAWKERQRDQQVAWQARMVEQQRQQLHQAQWPGSRKSPVAAGPQRPPPPVPPVDPPTLMVASPTPVREAANAAATTATDAMLMIQSKWREVKRQHEAVSEMQAKLEQEAEQLAVREARLQQEEALMKTRRSAQKTANETRRAKQDLMHLRKTHADVKKTLQRVKSQRDDFKLRYEKAARRAGNLQEQTSVLRQERKELLQMLKKIKAKKRHPKDEWSVHPIRGARGLTEVPTGDVVRSQEGLGHDNHREGRRKRVPESGAELLRRINTRRHLAGVVEEVRLSGDDNDHDDDMDNNDDHEVLMMEEEGDDDAELEAVLKHFSIRNDRWNSHDIDQSSQTSSQSYWPTSEHGDMKEPDSQHGGGADSLIANSVQSEREYMSLEEHELYLAEERRAVESDAAAALMAAETDMRAEYRAEIALYQQREVQLREEMSMLRSAVAKLLES